MKAIVLILIIAIISCSSIDKGFILEKFMDNPKELFKAYYTLFNKEMSYDINSKEGLKRFEIFKTNFERIKMENAKAGKQVFGITPFVDITNEEFESKYLMKTERLEEILNNNLPKLEQKPRLSKPFTGEVPQVDWRPMMNPVKDQGRNCKSSWAFGLTAAVEGNYNIKFGTLYDLSEQYLLDCDESSEGCDAGYPRSAAQFIANNGVIESKKYPYSAYQQFCKKDELIAQAMNIVPYFDYCAYPCDAERWYSLIKKGPIQVFIDAGGCTSNLRFFKPTSIDTPWEPQSCNLMSHVLTAVGVKIVGGKTLVILRNSWGPNWGVDGHFSMDAANSCFVMDEAMQPIVETHRPFPNPVCPLFYPSCASRNSEAISTCNGIANAKSELGQTIKGWEAPDSQYYNYWQFYQKNNCKGRVDTNYTSQACFAKTFTRNLLVEYNSVVSPHQYPNYYSVILYSGACSTGKRYYISVNIPDLAEIGLTSIGTVIFNYPGEYSKIPYSIALFDEVNYQGKGVSIEHGVYYNLDDHSEFANFVAKAKSLALIPFYI